MTSTAVDRDRSASETSTGASSYPGDTTRSTPSLLEALVGGSSFLGDTLNTAEQRRFLATLQILRISLFLLCVAYTFTEILIPIFFNTVKMLEEPIRCASTIAQCMLAKLLWSLL